MERALRNFIIIISIDITVFVASVVLWCSKRTKIILLIQNSLQGLHFLNRRKQQEQTQADNRRVTIDDVKYRVTYQSSYDSSSSGTDAENDDSNSANNEGESSSYGKSAAASMYIERKKRKTSTEGEKTTTRQKRKDTWWYYLYHGKHNKIRNNEAVLYLGFMRSTCIMLLICSVVAIVSNIVIFTHLTVNNKPHFLLTYSIEDLRTCKVTVWTLYATTWIYSIIVYVHILKFKQKVNKGKQITVMLRPQLHTIMIFGFDKNITDPTRFYRYFEKYFPEHVLSVHLVFNHSKRMALEEELKATKAQLCLCRDMSLLVDKSRQTDKRSAVTSSSGKEAVARRGDADAAPRKPRRSRSCGMLPEADMKGAASQYGPLRNCASSTTQGGTPRNCASSTNLLSLPKPAKPEPKKPSLAIPKGITRYVTRMLGKNDTELQDASDSEDFEDLGERFAGLLKKVRELKARIEEEFNREHTTSARICFVSFADSNVVLHILKDRNLLEGMPTWRIVPAPHPRDIIWQNLHLPRWKSGEIIQHQRSNRALVLEFYHATHYYGRAQLVRAPYHDKPHVEASRILDTNCAPEVPTVWTRVLSGDRYHTDTAGGVDDRLLGKLRNATMDIVQKIFDGAFDSLSLELGTVLVNTTWRFSTIYVINATLLGSSNQLLQLSQLSSKPKNAAL
ncbi:membrane protein, putative [Babesia ovata]|uniref:Membrane protein, putative n=1 Tax=Babesia ovata TaxID=189622 RepID=A0A2H6K6N1_9APIC|nr:uncharacterized protein BOVATA_001500 [Babesia ovata]GBE58657.1 membrane protein, putative [Babesia ovata]